MSGLNESIENLLEIKDEIKRAYLDPLGEEGVFSYSVKEKKESIIRAPAKSEESPAFCRACPLWSERRDDYFYYNPKKVELLSVVASVEMSGYLLLKDAEEMYEKQMDAISVERSKRALLPLLKCPSMAFNPTFADKCRHYLKDEMTSLEPKVMILFGMDLAHYMLRNDRSYEEIRAKNKSFKINGIRTFVTYSQRECINNARLKRDTWLDLQAIRMALN